MYNSTIPNGTGYCERPSVSLTNLGAQRSRGVSSPRDRQSHHTQELLVEPNANRNRAVVYVLHNFPNWVRLDADHDRISLLYGSQMRQLGAVTAKLGLVYILRRASSERHYPRLAFVNKLNVWGLFSFFDRFVSLIIWVRCLYVFASEVYVAPCFDNMYK